jgi:hypothetical protein
MEGVNMNRKKKQEAREKASTRQLMGIEGINGHSLATPHGELVFFMIKPTNISVLSESSVGARIYALMNVLKGIAEIEMLCLNSRENFEDILCNILESGKSVLCLDPEHEYVELAENLGGCFIDLMSGRYRINPLEPKTWDEGGNPEDTDAPQAFRQSTKLSQHISFLKDFFRCYKDFSDRHIDAIEIMLGKLYENFGISDRTDFRKLAATDYPILSDLYGKDSG